MGFRANQLQVKQAGRKLCDIAKAKVNSLMGPHGKKAYVRLDSDWDALDVANQTGIVQAQSSWLILNINFSLSLKKCASDVNSNSKNMEAATMPN